MQETEMLREAVERAIKSYDPIRTSETEIGVDVMSNGDVTLNGHVRTDVMRSVAAQLARTVNGVRSVRNLLLSDSALEIAVGQTISLQLGSYIVPLAPVVRAIRGHIFLRGPVPSEGAKEIATEIARQVPGVVMAHNLLEVDPVSVERLVAPKKVARRAAGKAGVGQQALVGGKPVTEADLPAWALKPKSAWGMAEYKARAKVKMAWKRGEAPDPNEMEAAGIILGEGATIQEPTEEAAPPPASAPLEADESATNPSAALAEEAIPAVNLDEVRARFPAWALKPKEEWDADDFKAQMQAKRAAKGGQGEAPDKIVEQAQAALSAAQQAGTRRAVGSPKNAEEAALAAVRSQFPSWAIVPRQEWRAQDFTEAADARVAEIRGKGRSVREQRADAQAALEAARRGESVAGGSSAKRRDLTAEEIEEVRRGLDSQFPAWALKPKEAWDKDDFKGQMQAKRAAKTGGPDPDALISEAQAALEAALKAAHEGLPLEESPSAAQGAPAPAKTITPELLAKYPGWALKPKETWDAAEFKAHAKAKSAFKKGEGADPDQVIAEAQSALA